MGRYHQEPVVVEAVKWIEGDWIIKGVKGEVYLIKDDIFRATYEPLPDEGAA